MVFYTRNLTNPVSRSCAQCVGKIRLPDKILAMKSLFVILYVCIFTCLWNCKPKEMKVEDVQEEPNVSSESVAIVYGICLWKEVSLREAPTEKGKYVTSVSLGEQFEVTSDTASETVDSRKMVYHRIKLSDGATGWIRKDFIAVDAKAGAFIADATVYKRPDLMTGTKKSFKYLDYVAIKQTSEDGWSEVIGKRKDDKWFTTGWVRTEALSTMDADVQFSALYNVVSEIPSDIERQEELDKLFLGDMFASSVFHQQNGDNTEEFSDGGEQEDFVETEYSEADTTSGDQ